MLANNLHVISHCRLSIKRIYCHTPSWAGCGLRALTMQSQAPHPTSLYPSSLPRRLQWPSQKSSACASSAVLPLRPHLPLLSKLKPTPSSKLLSRNSPPPTPRTHPKREQPWKKPNRQRSPPRTATNHSPSPAPCPMAVWTSLPLQSCLGPCRAARPLTKHSTVKA